MELTERTRVQAPLAEVWPLLGDPAAVAGCIPGAQLAPDQGDGVWRGSIRVRFGPTAAVFRGEATLDFDHEAHRCSIEGRGIDQRGASRALSSGTITATAEADETLLTVDGTFNVTGPLETFANAGGAHVARALLTEFSSNMAKLVAERRVAAPPSPDVQTPAAPSPGLAEDDAPASEPGSVSAPSRPPPASELGAAGLLWRAFKSWLRGLIRGRNR